MKHRQGMEAIKNLVPLELHRHIDKISNKKHEKDKLSNKMNMVSLNEKTIEDKHVTVKILNGPADKEPALPSIEENDKVDTKPAHIPILGSLEVKARQDYAGKIMEVSYEELVGATNNWDKANILGRGGFGIVYKGKWKFTDVAIKKMHYKGGESLEVNERQMEQSLAELRYLNSHRHDNILSIYAFSLNGHDTCLVYQLMLGGSLEHRLFCSPQKPPLTWTQRMSIAEGTARGLAFMHTVSDRPLVHGDIKSANILLDPCCQAKIADFGLAREASVEAKVISKIYGTLPYLAPEMQYQKLLSTKVDTFSFGVVLFEMATGLRPFDRSRERRLQCLYAYIRNLVLVEGKRVEELMDKRIAATEDITRSRALCEELLKLGYDCTFDNPNERPKMQEVFTEIERRIQSCSAF